MKYICLVLIVASSHLISCTHIEKSKKQNCNIGRIRISRHNDDSSGGYHIYVSLKIVNNTNDTLFLPSSDSIGQFPRSAFIGRITHDKIEFRELRSRSKILPKDSIYVRLVSLYYKPITNDSIFIKEIKKLNIEYEYLKSNKQTSSKYIKEINVQRTSKTRFEILEDNKSVEDVFLFGNEEFK
jgi:hypothetical protein